MKMCFSDALVGEVLKTSLFVVGLPDFQISLCETLSCGGMSKTKFMLHHFQQISMT